MNAFRRSLLALLVAALIPTAAFTVYQLVHLSISEQQSVEDETLARSQEILSLANARLTADFSILQVLTFSTRLDEGDLEGFKELARRVAEQTAGWTQIVLVDPETDQQIMNLLRPFSDLPLPAVIDESYLRAKERLEPAIGGTIPVLVASDAPVVPLRAPVIRDGKLRYVLSVGVRAGVFQDILMSRLPDRNISAAAIVDRDGIFIARSRDPELWIGKPATEYVRRAIAERRSGVYLGRTHEGIENYTAFTTSALSGWSVHIALDAGSLDAPRSRAYVLAAAAGLACLGLGAVLVVLVMRERAAVRRAEVALHQMQRLEALGKMTGGIAHDFNNLLAVIVGNVEMIRRRLGAAAPPQVERIAQAAERGEKLVLQMLAFAKRQPLRPQVIDVNRQIQTMTDLLKRAARGDIALVFDLADDTWPVEVDPTQLESALLNLALNARDAMPGGGTLRIATRNLAGSAEGRGDMVEVTVSDTGTGIAPNLLGQVFDPFFTTKAPGEGTGLGLSMVHGFAGQSGGAVEIESAVGVGTTVRLRLPRTRLRPDTRVSPAPGAVSAAAGHGNVLVVEDNIELREMTTTLLRELGYVVRAASAPAEAFEILGTFSADLIFSDILMPGGVNGVEFARQARRLYPRIEILLTSGDAGVLSRADHGEFPILQKPYRIDVLTQAISVALERRSTSAAWQGARA